VSDDAVGAGTTDYPVPGGPVPGTGGSAIATATAQRALAWQSIDSGRLLLTGGACLLVVVALAWMVRSGVTDLNVAIAFGVFIAFGELLRLALPGGREEAPIGTSAALAYAMVLHIAPSPARPPLTGAPALQVVAVTALGMALGALPHVIAGRRAGLTWMSARLLSVACVAFAFRALTSDGMLTSAWPDACAVMAVTAAAGWLVEAVVVAVIRAEDLRARYLVMIRDELRVQWRLALAVGVSAIVIVFGAQVLGIAELVVVAAPLLVIQLAFRRYAGIRVTYLQTIRALAQATEVGGYVASGHSRRVSRLAVAVGRALGMAEPDLLDLEFAALMHDIGQLSLVEPIPGGATLLVTAQEARRIAQLGAQVIEQAGVLDSVAEIVRCQWQPAHGYGHAEPPLASRVIKAASAFDDMLHGSTNRDSVAAALEHLRAGSQAEPGAWVEYDPTVVAALAVVTDRLPTGHL
jgi:response regulator RpfG family c-di-GMP phosphodiesterase